MDTQIIYELSAEDSEWWKAVLKRERPKIIKKPRQYVKDYLAQFPLDLASLKTNSTLEIHRVRGACWDRYLQDEVKFHRSVIELLTRERALPKEILSHIYGTPDSDYVETDDELSAFAGRVGDFCGRIMPFIYQLSLSTTNSRRSRAGQTFEEIIDSIMKTFDFPYASQGQLGTRFYRDNGLGKLVDGIIPSAEKYEENRSKCQIITMKTTLRERWQEVVEEINRTNIPHAYLLTLDTNLTESALETMSNHNITVVAPDEIHQRFEAQKNVISFTQLFNAEIPHALSYWK